MCSYLSVLDEYTSVKSIMNIKVFKLNICRLVYSFTGITINNSNITMSLLRTINLFINLQTKSSVMITFPLKMILPLHSIKRIDIIDICLDIYLNFSRHTENQISSLDYCSIFPNKKCSKQKQIHRVSRRTKSCNKTRRVIEI